MKVVVVCCLLFVVCCLLFVVVVVVCLLLIAFGFVFFKMSFHSVRGAEEREEQSDGIRVDERHSDHAARPQRKGQI
jgi:ABC-type bacteriocin/lantibiotic exporter with double-glycine peptidase domain